MIGNGQGQKVEGSSTGIQAGRDINIGISIPEVMAIIAQNIQIHTEAARQLVNERLNEFESRLTEKFSTGNTEAISSFSDPDMQAALLDAQKAYARSDSEDLHVILTDLIYQRANKSSRSRAAIALNDAISISTKLTLTDFSNLAFIFYVLNVGHSGESSTELISNKFRTHMLPLIKNVDFSDDALEYLHGHGLLLTGPGDLNLTPRPLAHVLKNKYPEVFNLGFTMEELTALSPHIAILNGTGIIASSRFGDGKFYICRSKHGLDSLSEKLAPLTGLGEKYNSACLERLVDDSALTDEVSKIFPEFREVCRIYDGSRVGVTRLSATAKAIAHAYLVKETGLVGELEIWIRS
ncbi:hypothetical protein DFO80_12027 [Rhodobacter sp. 140A]|nr:hypothetical protein DFO80_12027 [Rhodobacter sp. 140A]